MQSWLRHRSNSAAPAQADELLQSAISDLSYFEALAAFFKVIWPSIAIATSALYTVAHSYPEAAALLGSAGYWLAALNGLLGVSLLLFLPVLTDWNGRWTGRRFKLEVVSGPAENACHEKLTFLLRSRIWFFVFWRLEIALIAAYPFAIIINVILLIFSVPENAAIAEALAAIGVLLLAGPLILKLLVGHEFGKCRVAVYRIARRQ